MARKLVGTVASDVQDKTIIVAVARRVTHPVYGKQYTVTKRFAAHDEANEAHVGDRVEIVETRPISKNKTFRLARIIEAGHAATELKDETEAVTKKAVQAARLDETQGDAEERTEAHAKVRRESTASDNAAVRQEGSL